MTPVAHHPRLCVRDDFPDWMNPFLVKGLRQGLRNRAFGAAYIWVQVSMSLAVGCLALVGEDEHMQSMFTLFYWANIFVLFSVLVPLHPVIRKDEDIRPQNIELIRITNLSPDRIVMSKCGALAAYAALLAITLLPYQLLRHFLGGVDIARELEAFCWIAANMIVLAPCGMLAGSMSVAGRVALSALLLLGIILVLGGLIVILHFGAGGVGGGPWLAWIALSPIVTMIGFGLASAQYKEWRAPDNFH